METKRNEKYYTAPPVSIPAIVGWSIAAIGVILCMIDSLRLIGILVAAVGFVAVLVATGGASTDTDIEYQASEKVKDLQELNEKKHEVYEKYFLKLLRPIDLKGYDFEPTEEPFYYKKGKDGTDRTNYFEGCNMIFTNEKMFVYAKRFSLTDTTIDQIKTSSFFYTELDRAVLDEKTLTYKVGNKEVTVTYYVFNILKKDGTPAVKLCVKAGADIDKYVETISRTIVTRQVELEKKAKETAERRAAFKAQLEAERAQLKAEAEAEAAQ